ncbi:phenylacetate-CoA ligase [Algoriphagus locisalis]|uniref:Phenylacetate-CoA ligase n=1 Tax=Algoriphagus locisalis TaxID=305507 RepID=A0A1I6XQ09_9BACT|nr:phenylacetate--CoA ligase family protein [Algoriphagus locisalis]SFT40410.1 phenylacetate-CoA ligase [Algoriphagus locisalis]
MLTIIDLLKAQNYPIQAAQKELIKIQALSKDQFEDWKQKKSWEIVNFHFSNNPLYQKLVGKYLPDRWEDLPIVKKKDLQCEVSEKLSKGLKDREIHFGNTSGSSGMPLKYARDKFSHSMTWSLILDRYKKVGISPHDYQARFYGIPLGFPNYQKERLKDKLMNRFRFVVFDLSDDSMASFTRKFSENKFIYTYGYTNTQLFFARYLERNSLILKDICPSLRGTIVTSEQCTDEDKLYLERQFGVPVFNEYGASEVEFLAMSDLSGKRWLSSETLVTEVVDENHNLLKDGTSGSLIFTNIYNKAMPFIRYEVGDIGSIIHHEDHILTELDQLNGRLNDTVILPSGKKAAGFSLYYISKHLMTTLGYLQEYQVRQVEVDTFEVDIVMDQEADNHTYQAIQEGFDLYLEKGLKLKIRKVEKINREKSGKLKHFISSLGASVNS